MEGKQTTIRMRANFSVTAKGIYTPDVTVEISDVENTPEALEKAMILIEGTLSELHDKVTSVAESKGYQPYVIEQKK